MSPRCFQRFHQLNIHLTLQIASTRRAWPSRDAASNVQVTLGTRCVTNAVYAGTITATDPPMAITTTNNFTFNTWLTAAPTIFISSPGTIISPIPISRGVPLSGFGLSNLLVSQPNQARMPLIDMAGSNTIDYLEYDTNGTNSFETNAVTAPATCTGCFMHDERLTEDHDNLAAARFTDYCTWASMITGTWLDYTRAMPNATYAVYARMSGFPPQGGDTTMLMERAATPVVGSASQPRAAMGTFVCPSTGGINSWAFCAVDGFLQQPGPGPVARHQHLPPYLRRSLMAAINFQYMVLRGKSPIQRVAYRLHTRPVIRSRMRRVCRRASPFPSRSPTNRPMWSIPAASSCS